MQIDDNTLLRYFDGMYASDDGDIRCYSAQVVRTRSSHKCPGNFSGALHEVHSGSRMIREKALIDGKWETSYSCEACIIAWAKETGRIPS